MKTVTVPANVVKGGYQEWCVLQGHTPGVLSGAELTGKAREYGARYKESRDNLTSRLYECGITDDLVQMETRGVRRWCRVWVDVNTRERVRVEVEE